MTRSLALCVAVAMTPMAACAVALTPDAPDARMSSPINPADAAPPPRPDAAPPRPDAAPPQPDAAPPVPSLATGQVVYNSGDVITFLFAHGPGGAKDWIGVYAPRDQPGPGTPSTLWNYVGGGHTPGSALSDGVVNLSATSANYANAWPLAPGTYKAYWLLDDGYVSIATTTFTVK